MTYDVAQICTNGHIANSFSQWEPEKNEKYCEICGAPTITQCPNCAEPIRGGSQLQFIRQEINKPPNYCLNCGQSFPWTETRLKVARELAQEVEGIDQEDRETLLNSFDALVKDTPSANLAITKVKKVFDKLAPPTIALFRDILVGVISEAIKKQLFPS